MELISSKENKNIKEYGKLSVSKSYREETGRFVIESVKLIREAWEAGVVFEKVFVTQYCFQKNAVALQKLFETCETFCITESVEQKLTKTQNAGGIFAVCKKLDKRLSMDTIKTDGNYLFLYGLQDTGNVGTIIRTAEAFGMSGVIVSKDTCDLYSLKVLRASMGAVFRIPFYESGDPLCDLKELSRRFQTYAAVVSEDASSVLQAEFCAGSILVIGNEGNGLPPEAAGSCTKRITIPMRGNAESLNAAMAAGILIWECMK
jgi:TrmH family RNA methyltransferase